MSGGEWMNSRRDENAWIIVTKKWVNDPAAEKRKIDVRRNLNRHGSPARSA